MNEIRQRWKMKERARIARRARRRKPRKREGRGGGQEEAKQGDPGAMAETLAKQKKEEDRVRKEEEDK